MLLKVAGRTPVCVWGLKVNSHQFYWEKLRCLPSLFYPVRNLYCLHYNSPTMHRLSWMGRVDAVIQLLHYDALMSSLNGDGGRWAGSATFLSSSGCCKKKYGIPEKKLNYTHLGGRSMGPVWKTGHRSVEWLHSFNLLEKYSQTSFGHTSPLTLMPEDSCSGQYPVALMRGGKQVRSFGSSKSLQVLGYKPVTITNIYDAVSQTKKRLNFNFKCDHDSSCSWPGWWGRLDLGTMMRTFNCSNRSYCTKILQLSFPLFS